jgi:hypothetical protein
MENTLNVPITSCSFIFYCPQFFKKRSVCFFVLLFLQYWDVNSRPGHLLWPTWVTLPALFLVPFQVCSYIFCLASMNWDPSIDTSCVGAITDMYYLTQVSEIGSQMLTPPALHLWCRWDYSLVQARAQIGFLINWIFISLFFTLPPNYRILTSKINYSLFFLSNAILKL